MSSRFRQVWIPFMALAAVLAVAHARAESPAPLIVDVAMQADGALYGQVLDQQGKGLAKTQVVLTSLEQTVATTQSDDQGRFRIEGIEQGGVYQLTAAEGQASYRVWKPGTAPPVAQQQAVVVAGSRLVRGIPAKPVLFGATVAAIATAIAVPVALNSSHPSSP